MGVGRGPDGGQDRDGRGRRHRRDGDRDLGSGHWRDPVRRGHRRPFRRRRAAGDGIGGRCGRSATDVPPHGPERRGRGPAHDRLRRSWRRGRHADRIARRRRAFGLRGADAAGGERGHGRRPCRCRRRRRPRGDRSAGDRVWRARRGHRERRSGHRHPVRGRRPGAVPRRRRRGGPLRRGRSGRLHRWRDPDAGPHLRPGGGAERPADRVGRRQRRAGCGSRERRHSSGRAGRRYHPGRHRIRPDRRRQPRSCHHDLGPLGSRPDPGRCRPDPAPARRPERCALPQADRHASLRRDAERRRRAVADRHVGAVRQPGRDAGMGGLPGAAGRRIDRADRRRRDRRRPGRRHDLWSDRERRDPGRRVDRPARGPRRGAQRQRRQLRAAPAHGLGRGSLRRRIGRARLRRGQRRRRRGLWRAGPGRYPGRQLRPLRPADPGAARRRHRHAVRRRGDRHRAEPRGRRSRPQPRQRRAGGRQRPHPAHPERGRVAGAVRL